MVSIRGILLVDDFPHPQQTQWNIGGTKNGIWLKLLYAAEVPLYAWTYLRSSVKRQIFSV